MGNITIEVQSDAAHLTVGCIFYEWKSESGIRQVIARSLSDLENMAIPGRCRNLQ